MYSFNSNLIYYLKKTINLKTQVTYLPLRPFTLQVIPEHSLNASPQKYNLGLKLKCSPKFEKFYSIFFVGAPQTFKGWETLVFPVPVFGFHVHSHLISREQNCRWGSFNWSHLWRGTWLFQRHLLLCQRAGHVAGWLLLLLDVFFVADRAEALVACIAKKSAAISALNRVLLHLVGIAVHCTVEKGLKWVTRRTERKINYFL